MIIHPKGSPFCIFWHYATFSERKKSELFFKKNVLFVPSWEEVVAESYRALRARFGYLETVF